MLRWCLMAAIATCLGVTPAHGQELLAVDKLNGNIISVDCLTGAAITLHLQGVPNHLWGGMAMDSSGEIYLTAFDLQQPTSSTLYRFDLAAGIVIPVIPVSLVGINAIAFGPSDTLYAAVDVNYPGQPDFELFTIDLQTGTHQRIGSMGVAGVVQSMDCDGTTMFLWESLEGLHEVNLISGTAVDVHPGFTGNQDLSESLCFTETGTLFTLDGGLWITDSASGVSQLIGPSYFGILGGAEYLAGPNSMLTAWQTGIVGQPSFLHVRGATPGGQVAVFLSADRPGPVQIPAGFPCAGTQLDLDPRTVRMARLVLADGSGEVRLGPTVLPPGARGNLRMQALDLQACAKSPSVLTVF